MRNPANVRFLRPVDVNRWQLQLDDERYHADYYFLTPAFVSGRAFLDAYILDGMLCQVCDACIRVKGLKLDCCRVCCRRRRESATRAFADPIPAPHRSSCRLSTTRT